ncbi:hypothetical protein [Myxosarcina sp. GI1]|uniref:hypothetical protein n=1 Tax=Myxosarcina sp. GI1 TaxID=1541065 RepID=UPI00056B7551|nr:hypothetical protein [Myxosarcina sp. GI1]
MNFVSSRPSRQINWQTIIMFALGFWLSGSLVLDCLIIPGLLSAGMMNEPGFAGASYTIFGSFNHVEALCAALVLTGCLVFRYGDRSTMHINNKSIFLATVLLAIALVYTYNLTPHMSAMGLSLNQFESIGATSGSMTTMHVSYWILEATKLICGATLLRSFYRNSCSLG